MSGEREEEKGVKIEWIEGDMDEYKMSRWMDGWREKWLDAWKSTWMNVEERLWKKIFKLLYKLIGLEP